VSRAAMDSFDLQGYGIDPDPLLGQNFLIDKTLINQEVELLGLSEKDSVLEIGPGMGSLTERILERCASVAVIEKDRRFERRLSELGSSRSGLRILWADAMEADIPPFTKVISNLPFRIALPLAFRILEHDFDLGVLVFQKRLALRICAKSSEDHFCRISVQIQRLADVSIVRIIPPEAFVPRPAVDCALVLVKKRVKFSVPDELYFKRVLDYLFFRRESRCRDVLGELLSSRRRILRSCVSALGAKAGAEVKSLDIRDFGLITGVLHDNSVDVPAIPDNLKRISQKLGKGGGHDGHQRHARAGDGRLERDRPGHRAGARPTGRKPGHHGTKRG
jgi:16S rRNA (adenine1518-N6/adenine1519-N6)-dimethyltransferase